MAPFDMSADVTPLPKEPTPEGLIERIRLGDRRAEQLLVDRYWRGLMFVLNRHTNQDHALAQDLAQDTFLTVISKARNNEIHNPSALSAFIRQVGINLTIAHFRKQSVSHTEACDDIDVRFANGENNLSDHVCREELIEIIVQVMEELPKQRDRDILTAFYMGNASKAKLCDNFDLTPEHFDRVLYRAKERLRTILSARLNIDVQQTNLSHLLSLVLMASSASITAYYPMNADASEVRELTQWAHHNNSLMVTTPRAGSATPACEEGTNKHEHLIRSRLRKK